MNVALWVIVAILLIITIVVAYFYLKQSTLNSIRKDVYQLILKAENIYKYKDNKQKFTYVLNRTRTLLPAWARLFITDALLEKVVQLWFIMVKDLLDDGKINKSQTE